MTWWRKLTSFFRREDPPIVRLCNAILLNALKHRATVIYLESGGAVRLKIGGTTRGEMQIPDTIFPHAVARFQEMAQAEDRMGTIHLLLGRGRKAVFELRPYGPVGLVITIEENPLPVPTP